MRRADIVTAFILALLSVYFMWKSGEPPAWNPGAGRFSNVGFTQGEGAGSGFWPFWLSAAMLACCIWIIVNWFRGTSPPSKSDKPFLDTESRRFLALVSASLLGFLIAIETIGFYGAIALFLFFYIRFLGGHSVRQATAISVTIPVVCFFFFDVAMRIVLPKGYSEPLFIPLYDLFL